MIVIDLSTAAGILTGTAALGFLGGHRFATRQRRAADERAAKKAAESARPVVEIFMPPHRSSRTVREAREADRG